MREAPNSKYRNVIFTTCVFFVCQSAVTNLQHWALGGSFTTPSQSCLFNLLLEAMTKQTLRSTEDGVKTDGQVT